MEFKMENFFSPAGLNALRTQGLHKIAGAMAGVPELTLKEASMILGTKARLRRQEFRKIAAGLVALSAVTGG